MYDFSSKEVTNIYLLIKKKTCLNFRKVIHDSKRKSDALPVGESVLRRNHPKHKKQENGEQMDKVKDKGQKRKFNDNDKVKGGDLEKVKKRKFDPSSAKAIQLKFKGKLGKRQNKTFVKKGGKKGGSKSGT